MTSTFGYKFLTDDLRSKNDPEKVVWQLGKWRKHSGKLKICKSGFHASKDPYDSLHYVYGPRWFQVEARGEILKDTDKFTASEMRLVKELPTKLIAVRFSITCARRCLGRFEEKYPEDDRPRKAIEAAEAWVKNPCEATASAASAAWSAASAAWSAESAARSAEEAWQRKTLQEIIREYTNYPKETMKK